MKTNLKLISILSAFAIPFALGAIDIYEGFDYPDGSPLGQQGGTGWNTVQKPNGPGDPAGAIRDEAAWGSYPIDNAWGGDENGDHQGIGISGGAIPQVIQASTLTPPANYGFTPIGKELFGNFYYNWSWREFDPAFYIDMDSGSPVYFSFLMSQDNIDSFASSYSRITFVAGDRTEVFHVGIGTGLSTTSIEDSTNTAVATGETAVAGTSYLFIGKIVPGGATSTVSLSAYTSAELIPAAETWEMTAVLDLSGVVLDRIGMKSGGFEEGVDTVPEDTRRGHFDELRFGDSYSAVTGLVAASAPTSVVIALGGANQLDISFDSEVGVDYQLEKSTDGMSSWGLVGSPEAGTGSNMTLSDPSGKPTAGNSVFYRVITL